MEIIQIQNKNLEITREIVEYTPMAFFEYDGKPAKIGMFDGNLEVGNETIILSQDEKSQIKKIVKEMEKPNSPEVQIIIPTPKERNIEKLLRYGMKHHKKGTYYSDEYLSEIRKVIKSPTGKIGWRPEI